MALGPDGTGYFIVERGPGAFEVEVMKPGNLPEHVKGFTSNAGAERWILQQISPHATPMPGTFSP